MSNRTPEARDEGRARAAPAGEATENRGGQRQGLLRNLWTTFQERDVADIAASIAYFSFLSLPPTILVLFALTGFFGGDEVAAWVTAHLSALLPEESAGLIDGFVDSVVYTQAPGALSIGLVLAVWAGSNVFMSIMRAMNLAYEVEDRRGFVRQRALAIGVMLLFVVMFLAASAALLMGPQIGAALDPFGLVGAVWQHLHAPIALLVVVAAFWITYYTLPARRQSDYVREILIGAIVAAVLWLAATAAFRFYIGSVGTYNETYGFLGGIIVLLLWLYLTGVVILIGALLAAELENRAGTR